MQKQSVGVAAILAAVVGVSTHSAWADIIGFTDFSAVNISGPSSSNVSMTDSSFELTDGQTNETVSAWDAAPQSIASFTTSFTYQATGDSNWLGDGAAIVFQNPITGSVTALGNGGNGLGYTGIGINSAAIALDLYNGQQSYRGGVELGTAGQQSQLNDISNVNLSTGDTMLVRLSYSGATLTQTLVDLSTDATASETFTNVNLPAILGSNTAMVGITAATDGHTATQTMGNFAFHPISPTAKYLPIGVTGFNQSMVVPAGTSNAAASVSATMDQGTADGGFTFFEQGLDSANPTLGLPASGSTFTSQNDSNHVFQMQSYSGASALLLTAGNPTGTLTFSQPQPLEGLSILLADGNGSEPFDVTAHFVNGTSETIADAVSPDWFNNGTVAWNAQDRVDVDNGSFDVEGNNPYLYQVDLGLNDQTDAISSLTFNFDGPAGDNSNMAIFAVSAASVPEPASGVIIGIAALLLGRRRRRTGLGR